VSYQITLTNGNVLTVVPDTQLVSTYASLDLIGKDYDGFGTVLNNNLVHIIENFADSVPPNNPIVGQVWYDTVSNSINFWNGTQFQTVGIFISSATAPLNPQEGDEWYDTINQQLNIWNGFEWILIGPVNQSSEDKEGFVVESFPTGNGTVYYLNLYANNNLLGIVSSVELDNPGITGFGNIRPGLNFVTNPESISNIVSAGVYNATELTIGNDDQTSFTNDPYDNTVLQNNDGNILIATNGNVAAYNYANGSIVSGTVFVNTLSASTYIGLPSAGIPATIGQVVYDSPTGLTGTSLVNVNATTSNVTVSASSFAVLGNALVFQNETVFGALSVVGLLTTQGNAIIDGNLIIDEQLIASENATVQGNLIVEQNATIQGTLTVDQNSNISENLNVLGLATFNTGVNAFSLPTSNGSSGTTIVSAGNGTTTWSTANISNISLGSNSNGHWVKDATGCIRQWGSITGSGSIVTGDIVPFPTSFSDASTIAVNATSITIFGHGIGFISIQSGTVTTAQFQVEVGAESSVDGLYWEAIGF
jgi:hypothetical protein